MSTAHRDGGRLRRWLGIGTGRLTRGSDRIEIVFRWVVLLGFLVAVPFGAVVGSVIQKNQTAVAAEQVRERHTVRAVVLDDTDVPANAWMVSAPIAWTGDDSTRHTAAATVPVNSQARTVLAAGTTVTIWVTAAGQLSTPPLDPSIARGYAVWGGIVAAMGAPVAAGCLLWLVHALLDVHRFRRWEAGWQAVEPLWNSRSG